MFRNGQQPIWVSNQGGEAQSLTATDGVDSCTMTPVGLVLQQQNGTATSFIESDNAGNIVLTPNAGSAIRMFPSGIARGGILVDSSNLDSATIAPFDPTQTQLICQASVGFRAITGTGTSGVGMGEENTGVINWVTVTTAGTLNIQFAGSGVIAGSYFDFVLNPSSFAGATVSFSNNSSTIVSVVPSSAPVGSAFFVRIFTPDGTVFYRVKQNFD